MEVNKTRTALDKEFDVFWSNVNCFVVLNFPYEERCEFVKKAKNCIHGTNFVPYMHLFACHFKCKNQFQELVFVAIFFFVCLELVLCLGYAAHYYYSPALKVVSRMLHMNEHLAGVTILAFGNTSPELFSNLTSHKDNVPVFGNCLSTALFVVMFVGGLICYLCPFKMSSYSIVRDLLFLILGVTLLEYMISSDGLLSIRECCILALVYIVYLVVNVLDLYLMHVSTRSLRVQIDALDSIENTQDVKEQRRSLEKKYNVIKVDQRVDILKREQGPMADGPSFTYMTKRPGRRARIDMRANRRILYNEFQRRNQYLFRDFFYALRPVDLADWRKANMLMRTFYIIRAPIVIICALYIPLVDYEKELNGWNKLLNCLQIIINPAITITMGSAIIFREKSRLWYSTITETCKYGFYSFAITVPISIFVFCHSRTGVPPAYHWLYTILNLTGSMFLTFQCASEIALIIDVCGHILKVESDFMGATVSAIASALGNLVTNTSLALLGYEKMAYAATIGSPFFSVLLGTGAVLASRILSGGSPTIENMHGKYGENAFVLLLLGLLSTLLWTALLNYNSRRSVGIFSMGIYLLYLVFTLLIRYGIIQPYIFMQSIQSPIVMQRQMRIFNHDS
ncbi:putative sodium/calcium exchanger 7 [Drosophila novamexicana]|uniref:putative sodium/calcium exchanger 7 n=1 Tax=Drosophila novamexicana TaxID=47314 RepID=UPI0011E5E7AF|nr:putative sodium/calcium exchanger 7 [Drosophila novamexicana]